VDLDEELYYEEAKVFCTPLGLKPVRQELGQQVHEEGKTQTAPKNRMPTARFPTKGQSEGD